MPSKEDIAAELGWWVFIDDQYAKGGPDLWAFGPYPDEEAAKKAGNDSAIIDAQMQEGGVECFWEEMPPSQMHKVAQDGYFSAYTLEVVIIDLTDPYNTGEDADEYA